MPTNGFASHRGPNPLLEKWPAPFAVPPFDEIKAEHYLPAFRAAVAEQGRELDAITANPAAPTFGNTVEALEDSGAALERIEAVFSAMVELDDDEALHTAALTAGPLLANHRDDLHFNAALFERIERVHAAGGEELPPEGRTLLEHTYRRFRRSGAQLTRQGQERLRALHTGLALLELKYEENLRRETDAFRLVVHHRRELEGLPESLVAAAAELARMSGHPSAWAFDLHGSSLWPCLEHAGNRDLRRRLLEAYQARCDQDNGSGNNGLASRLAALRCEKARLLGYPTYAHYALEERMAGTPEAAYAFLDRIREPALRRARAEAGELQALLERDDPRARLEPWDWRFYAARTRKARYGLDTDALRPFFPLDQVREGAFLTAGRLYGLTFTERKDLPTCHREVRAFVVKDREDRFLGVWFADYHPRPGKRGGAWMGNFRRQGRSGGRDLRPLVYNAANFPRPVNGAPSLLSLDEVRTLFHEFGHALHALLRRCRYRSLSGAAPPLDFSEMPSQIMESWAMEPEVLALFARHYRTGDPLPPDLAAGIREAARFNQGFLTTEFLASAYLDLDWHSLEEPVAVDARAFETECLERLDLPPEIPARYRTPTFPQSMCGEGAAGYYGYLWSAVLEADAFGAFKATGDPFDPGTSGAFRAQVLEKGASEEAMVLYRRFRQREPEVEALLEKRGLC